MRLLLLLLLCCLTTTAPAQQIVASSFVTASTLTDVQSQAVTPGIGGGLEIALKSLESAKLGVDVGIGYQYGDRWDRDDRYPRELRGGSYVRLGLTIWKRWQAGLLLTYRSAFGTGSPGMYLQYDHRLLSEHTDLFFRLSASSLDLGRVTAYRRASDVLNAGLSIGARFHFQPRKQ